MPWNLPPTIVNADERTAAYFNAYRDCLGVLGLHSHTAADGDGAVLSGMLGMMDGQTQILFYSNPDGANVTNGLLGALEISSPPGGYGAVQSTNFVYLRSGIYTLTVYYETTVNSTFDVNSSPALALLLGQNVRSASISITTSGLQSIRLYQFFYFASNYVRVNFFNLTRTGDIPGIISPALTWNTRTFTAGEVLRASHLNQIRDNFNLLSSHSHNGELGQGSDGISGAEAVLPQVQILARFPKSTTGFTYSTSTNYRLGFVAQSSAQNDEIIFPVGLQAGTYRLEFLYGKGSNCGIATFYLDASSLGTIDTYNASTSYNDNSSITSITVAASGWYEFKIKGATKNASSSGYVLRWQAVNLVRTGA